MTIYYDFFKETLEQTPLNYINLIDNAILIVGCNTDKDRPPWDEAFRIELEKRGLVLTMEQPQENDKRYPNVLPYHAPTTTPEPKPWIVWKD